METQQYGDCDKANRQRGGVLTNGEAGDDIRCMTGLRSARNFLHGLVTHRCVVIGNRHHDGGHDQADEGSQVQLCG